MRSQGFSNRTGAVTTETGVSYVSLIEGGTDNDPEVRRRLEAEVFGRLARCGIAIDLVSVDAEGIGFVIETHEAARLRRELAGLNLAVRIRPSCAQISIANPRPEERGMLARVIGALTGGRISIVRCASSTASVSIVVSDRDTSQAERVLRALSA